MPFVSAKYAPSNPLDLPGQAQGILATDSQGQVWSLREDSEVGDWLEYLAEGGTVDAADPLVIDKYMVDAERDRRITGGFDFMGHKFQSDDFAQRNIADASQAADAAIAQGVAADDYRWQAGATEDFVWIDADNHHLPMTAYDVRGLAQTMLRWKQAMIFNARALKDMDPMPLDYAADTHWPFEAPPELPV